MTEFGAVTGEEKHTSRGSPTYSQVFWDPLPMLKWFDLQRRKLAP